MKFYQRTFIFILATLIITGCGDKPKDPKPSGNSEWLINSITDRLELKLSISALILSMLSLGINGTLFWLLKLSNTRLENLEKKRRGDKDELRKWVSNIDQNLKIVLSKQTELDRKIQQQTKTIEQQELSKAHGFHEQIGYGSTPFVSPGDYSSSVGTSPIEQAYTKEDSVHRTEQSPPQMIAQKYNDSPNLIASSAEGVSETEDSIYRRRRDSSIKKVTLQNVSNYTYWVIADSEGGYWLTPIADLKLNPMNFDTFQALFQHNGNHLDGKLTLTKPAKVAQFSGQWELLEQGEVQFV